MLQNVVVSRTPAFTRTKVDLKPSLTDLARAAGAMPPEAPRPMSDLLKHEEAAWQASQAFFAAEDSGLSAQPDGEIKGDVQAVDILPPQKHYEALRAVMAAPPTTGNELLAMLDMLESREGRSYFPEDGQYLAAVFGAVRSYIGGRPAPEPDPVFALIAQEKQAWAVFDAFEAQFEVLDFDEASAREDVLSDARYAIFQKVLASRPTTAAGMAAAIDLVVERYPAEVKNLPDIAKLLRQVRSFLRTRPLPENDRLDEAFATLGARLDANALEILKHENRGEDCPATLYDENWDVRRAIDPLPASSMATLATKARAVAEARRGDVDADCVGPGSFVSLASSLAGDIIRLAGPVPNARYFDEVEASFRMWLALGIASESVPPGQGGDEPESLFNRILDARVRLENAFVERLPDTPSRVAAALLVDAYHEFMTVDTPPSDEERCGFAVRFASRLLPCLRPFLTGCLAEVADDLLAHQDRPFQFLLLGGADKTFPADWRHLLPEDLRP